MESILLIVRSVTQAQLMERALWKAGIRASISRTPMELTANSGCTYAVRIAAEDLAAMELGIPCFLLTDCLINRNGRNVSDIPQGSFAQLIDFIEKL